MFTAIVETHHSGRATGSTFAVEGDVFGDESHPQRHNWLMGNWSLFGVFANEQEAEEAAAARVAFDDEGWADWA